MLRGSDSQDEIRAMNQAREIMERLDKRHDFDMAWNDAKKHALGIWDSCLPLRVFCRQIETSREEDARRYADARGMMKQLVEQE